MPQRTLPICIECGAVIEGYFGRGNRPILCDKPKKCRSEYKLHNKSICARPGCRKPFKRDTRADGKPMSSQRFCWDHQVYEFNQHPCLWCGEPCVETKNKMQLSGTIVRPKWQHAVDYCCVEHKLLAWNYPGQPKPMCSVCHTEIKAYQDKKDFETPLTWFAVMDPPNAHYECWRHMRHEEQELYQQLHYQDPRIVQYTLKIQVPQYFQEISAKETMIEKILNKLKISSSDIEATVDERAKIIKDYRKWQVEHSKLSAQRGMVANKK